MEIILEPNQSLTISSELINGRLHINVSGGERTKPGPKSLPKTTMKSTDFHLPIIDALRNGPLHSDDIRALLSETPDMKNTISWALVELQNENCKRGNKARKIGPVEKLSDGRYSLRP